MTEMSQFEQLQRRISYDFNNADLLQRALLAPGNKEKFHQERYYEGSRDLAPLGLSMLVAILENVAFRDKAVSRGKPNQYRRNQKGLAHNVIADANWTIKNSSTTDHCAKVAVDLNIDSCMVFSVRQQGKPPKTTLSLGLRAVIGAVWIDCGQDFTILENVIKSMSLVPVWRSQSSSQSQGPSQGSSDSHTSNKENTPRLPSTRSSVADSPPGGGFFDEAYRGPVEKSLTPSETSDFQLTQTLGSVTPLARRNSTFSHSIEASPPRSIRLFSEVADGIFEFPATPVISHQADFSEGATVVIENELTHGHLAKKSRLEQNTSGSSVLLLQGYLANEYNRHADLDMSWMQRYKNYAQTISNHGVLKRYSVEAERLYLALGSPEAVATLRAMLVAQRNPHDFSFSTGYEIDKQSRFEIIQRLSDKESLFKFLKRYHTFRLYSQCKDSQGSTEDPFIVHTSHDFTSTKSRGRGNPIHMDESSLTKSMIADIYPTMTIQNPRYKNIFNSMTRIRQLGKRLSVLVERIDIGILLLLPGNDFKEIMNISDTLLRDIPERAFSKIVEAIDSQIGPFLRVQSKIVAELIPYLCGESTVERGHGLVNIDEHDILNTPRVPQVLENLLSSTISINSN